MIKYYLFFLVILVLYGGLYWFSLRGKQGVAKLAFFVSSAIVFTTLTVFMFANLFFTLFGAVLFCFFAIYVGDNAKVKNGIAIKNGAFGGLWLSIPLYLYLVSNT